jgi:predicted Zn finger-like uncharacterized protein
MNVTCPQCNTVYRLPNDKIKPGAKLRCSVCRNVFTLPKEEEEQKEEAPLVLGTSFSKDNHSVESELKLADNPFPESSVPEDSELSFGNDGVPLKTNSLCIASDTERCCGTETSSSDTALKLTGTSDIPNGGLNLPQKKRTPLRGVGSILFCMFLCACGWWMWQNTPYLDGLKTLLEPYTGISARSSDPVSMVAKLELHDVRQYQVKNERLGNLIVIEGKVRNGFATARELIRLEAELYDTQGKMLVSHKQLAGTSISSFQLEVLDKEELDKVLNNRMEITSSNINVLPGSEVPFTIVFVDAPAEASDYKVRIAEASLPTGSGNLLE